MYCKRALCGCGCATDLYTAYFRWRYHEYVNFMIASDVNGTLTVLKNALDLDTRTLLRLLSTFRAIDEDESGMVDMVEFCDYFELDRHCPHKRLISRIFGTFDTDREGASSGQLDAAEFIVGMVRICTMRKDELCKFVFDLFDVDGSGELDKKEIAVLARELLNIDENSTDKKADAMIKAFDADNDGVITLNEWRVIHQRQNSLIRPIIEMQFKLRAKSLGNSGWRKLIVKLRKKLEASGCDDLAQLYEQEAAKGTPETLLTSLAAPEPGKDGSIDPDDVPFDPDDPESVKRYRELGLLDGDEPKTRFDVDEMFERAMNWVEYEQYADGLQVQRPRKPDAWERQFLQVKERQNAWKRESDGDPTQPEIVQPNALLSTLRRVNFRRVGTADIGERPRRGVPSSRRRAPIAAGGLSPDKPALPPAQPSSRSRRFFGRDRPPAPLNAAERDKRRRVVRALSKRGQDADEFVTDLNSYATRRAAHAMQKYKLVRGFTPATPGFVSTPKRTANGPRPSVFGHSRTPGTPGMKPRVSGSGAETWLVQDIDP